MKKQYIEALVPAPWGNIAIMTHGEPSSEPVLMLHGRLDTAACFIPLLEVLPNNYFYVLIDLPGHGKSDPFPKGFVISRYLFVHAINQVVKHMGWSRFIFIAHSMGCDVGLFYNAAHPGMMSKAVLIDAGPSFQRLDSSDQEHHFKHFYHKYYTNFDRYNGPNRLYTKQHALQSVMRARGVSEDLARVLLSRSLVKVEGDKYRLSWDPRSKFPVPQTMLKEDYLTLFTANTPPVLIISMSDGHKGHMRGMELSLYLIENMVKKIKNAKLITLEGGHDHHVTNPLDIKTYVEEFLKQNFDLKSKL